MCAGTSITRGLFCRSYGFGGLASRGHRTLPKETCHAELCSKHSFKGIKCLSGFAIYCKILPVVSSKMQIFQPHVKDAERSVACLTMNKILKEGFLPPVLPETRPSAAPWS